jgi:uncharacterized protein YyaL (SSP411 family)
MAAPPPPRVRLAVALATAAVLGGADGMAEASSRPKEVVVIETPPGAAPFPPELAARLAAAVAARGPGAEPRTRHRNGGAPRFTNRLALESSPYLLQHAHNPVSWWPWGDEAFAEARATRRPVFLSIGYSTCHWCHVMEEESFEDLEIARFLNEHYVAIKVDREERPDVDAVYMTAVQALTGGGGWPMSVFLNADREPFFGGTYFPARDGDRGAPRGFLSLLAQIDDLWTRDPLRVSRAAGSLAGAVRVALGSSGAPAEAVPGAGPIEAAAAAYLRRFDEEHGGLSGSPKFPSSLPVRLLLRHHRRTGSAASLHMALLTLERMAAGGIHDQVGGGFHRYSTDERWLVPHFEKMLYDNALLAVAYAEAFQATGRRDLARVTRTTLDYVLREMTAPEGGFYSATDADSEGEEGRFFVWSEEEIQARLGSAALRFVDYYGVTPQGNFEGKSILRVPRPDEATWESLAPEREKLRLAREERPHPLLDEKVLTAWNGLTVSALAVGGRALGEPRYLDAAARAADFLLGALRREGRLHRSWKAGRLGPPGFLEDHAFLAQGLLDLAEATLDPRWLEEALRLAEETERLFADPERGGWFVTASDGESLIARERPTHDGAEPSGASVATLNALRLAALTADDRWRQVADRALRVYAPALGEQPTALHDLLLALDFRTDAVREVVLVWPEGQSPAPFLEALRGTFLPSRVLCGAPEGPALERLARVARVAEGKKAIGGRPAAYVCEQGACQLPAREPGKLLEQLRAVRPLRGRPG